MRWDSEPYEAKLLRRWKRMNQWHRWFAWYPVRVGEQRVWWEWIERRITVDYFHEALTSEYRFLTVKEA